MLGIIKIIYRVHKETVFDKRLARIIVTGLQLSII